MTDIEYCIINEIYFVTRYDDIKSATGFDDEEIKVNLVSLIAKGFVKVYHLMEEELALENIDMERCYKSYFYVASKKGLFEHNQR
ncbi:MAG: transporter [Ekhidna sp.]|nr:transporter [Ekhidna sp.]